MRCPLVMYTVFMFMFTIIKSLKDPEASVLSFHLSHIFSFSLSLSPSYWFLTLPSVLSPFLSPSLSLLSSTHTPLSSLYHPLLISFSSLPPSFCLSLFSPASLPVSVFRGAVDQKR